MVAETEKYGAHDLIYDLAAYVRWAVKEGRKPDEVLVNVVHDLQGYIKERDESWWSPRTKGYFKPSRG